VKRKTFLQSIVLILIIGFGFIILPKAPEIGDRVRLLNYQPSYDMAELSEQAGMSRYGRRLFYVYDPEFSSEARLKDACGDASKPIGCISDNKILILEPDTKDDNSESIVTAAHEMLHVAYSRLDYKEKSEVDKQINSVINNLNPSILNDIEDYRGIADKVMADEAYAIVGSEADSLPKNLKGHYSKYFSDRQKTVDAYKQSRTR
jgi:hypothetical protein